MDSITATWVVKLNCECPKCEEWVDLTTHPDFWSGRHLEIPETGTFYSKDIPVTCPKCDGEFEVTLDY